jgi:hypothetical protein
MLHWPAGPRATDGIWAKYWYDAVERSTAAPANRHGARVPARLKPLLRMRAAQCAPPQPPADVNAARRNKAKGHTHAATFR